MAEVKPMGTDNAPGLVPAGLSERKPDATQDNNKPKQEPAKLTAGQSQLTQDVKPGPAGNPHERTDGAPLGPPQFDAVTGKPLDDSGKPIV